jgi:hypothetical protein
VQNSPDARRVPERVELDLRQAGFEIVSRQDRFIESDPDNETWWIADLFVEVDGAQLTALVSSGEIQTDERAEARVSMRVSSLKIEVQAAFGRNSALHLVLQESGILVNEIAATLHDGGFRSGGDGQAQPGI